METIKKLSPKDISVMGQPFHEAFLAPGTIIDYRSPYGSYPENTNVVEETGKNYLQVFDYIATDSSASLGFGLTYATHEDSVAFNPTGSALTDPFQWEYPLWTYDQDNDAYYDKRKNMYNMLSQYLLGFDEDGSVRKFDRDGDFATTSDKMNEVIAIAFSRFAQKDEIKKGSFQMILGMNPTGHMQAGGAYPLSTPYTDYNWTGAGASTSLIKVSDFYGTSQVKTNAVRGEYAILYAQPCLSDGTVVDPSTLPGGESLLSPAILDSDFKVPVGLVFYQAGVAILTPWLWGPYDANLWSAGRYGYLNDAGGIASYTSVPMYYDRSGSYIVPTPPPLVTDVYNILHFVRGYQYNALGVGDLNIPMTDFAHAFRQRIYQIQFQNTVQLNSTLVFCHLRHNEFNYSANPTYTTDSKINVKEQASDLPVTYITEIALHAPDGAVLAYGTFSTPRRKDPNIEDIVRARLDF